MKKKTLFIFIITCIVIFILALWIVSINCKGRTVPSSSTDICTEEKQVYYNDTVSLDELTKQMFIQMEQEELFEQAYLHNSLYVNQEDIKIVGNIVYNEARGLSKTEQSAVVWVILNRCARDNKSIREIATAPKQFAYKPILSLKTDKAKALLKECEALAKDVIVRYMCEQDGIENVGRTLPNNYYSYWGDGKENHFRTNVGVYEYWNWGLNSPYEEDK